jgi:hypothetical protein
VPLQRNRYLQERPGYVVFTLLFILFGLAIFSALVNLLVLRFMATNKAEHSQDDNQSKAVTFEQLA